MASPYLAKPQRSLSEARHEIEKRRRVRTGVGGQADSAEIVAKPPCMATPSQHEHEEGGQ